MCASYGAVLARGTAKPATDSGTIGAVGLVAGQAKRDEKANKPLGTKAPSVVVVRAKRKPGEEAAKKKKKKMAKVETRAEAKAPADPAKGAGKTDKTNKSTDSDEKTQKKADATKAGAPAASALGLVAYSSDSD